MNGTRTIYECPNGVCGFEVESGPCRCVASRRSGRITYATRESVPVVDARLTDELIEKASRAVYDTYAASRSWEVQTDITRDLCRAEVKATLLAAGFTEGQES